MGLTICPVCKEKFNRELVPFVLYKKRHYHEECFRGLGINIEEQEATEESKKILFDYFKVLFKSDTVSPLVCKQLNDFINNKEKKYTYSGIYKTLYYFFEVRGEDKTKSNGIGIVPFVYDEAKEYFFELYKMEKFNENITEPITGTYEVKIKKPVRNPTGRRRLITMEDDDE